jgi:hypothetical protein
MTEVGQERNAVMIGTVIVDSRMGEIDVSAQSKAFV